MMTRVKLAIVLVLVCYLCFCGHETRNDKGVLSPQLEEKTRALTESETTSEYQKIIENIVTPMVVSENTVVFLIISSLERDIQPKEIQSEIDEIVDDFYTYRHSAKEKLQKCGINNVSAISKNLVFRYSDGREENLFFDPSEYPVAIALFGKGKRPKILHGVILDDDIIKEVSEYFEIEIK